MILQNDESIKLLNTVQEKQVLFDKQGIDHLIIQPFDKAFSRTQCRGICKNSFGRKIKYKKNNHWL